MQKTWIDGLCSIVSVSGMKTDAQDIAYYGCDWTKSGSPQALCVVLPRTTEEVAKLVQYARSHNLKIVPSGGRTGLAGGAMALQGEIILSLERMRRVLDIDVFEPAMTVEAGCTLQQVQQAAQEQGLFFPLDLGAKGSCHIGGNVATNAGGLHFIRYGGARDQILGLKVVDGLGRILQLGHGLKKDNSGYDLKQLIIGSEGTLGIVTEVILRLQGQAHNNLQVSVCAVSQFEKILEILKACRQRSLTLNAFEFFTKEALGIVMREKSRLAPLDSKADFYVLLEVDAEREVLEEALADFFEKGLVEDGTIASSETESRHLWGYRELITESIAGFAHVLKNDITVRIRDLPGFVAEVKGLLQPYIAQDLQIVLFGHVGDGNIHLNYIADQKGMSKAEFIQKVRPLVEAVFGVLQKYHGSISAEHGIGLIKKKELLATRSPEEIAIMRDIKKIFDPASILNPGKIFD